MKRTNFSNKVILITGGASGLGASLAASMATLGGRVLVLDKDERSLENLKNNQPVIEGYHADVTEPVSIKDTIRKILDSYGNIDFLINCAGVFNAGEARDFSARQWKECIEVNLLGTVNMIAEVYPLMVTRKSGQIVNIASMVGLAPLPLIIPYVTSKYGIIGLTRSLRIEAATLGIRVNVVCPGRLDTTLLEKSEIVNADQESFIAAMPLKPYPLSKAVHKIINGISRNKGVILFPWYVNALWYAERFSSRLLFPAYALAMNKFRKMKL